MSTNGIFSGSFGDRFKSGCNQTILMSFAVLKQSNCFTEWVWKCSRDYMAQWNANLIRSLLWMFAPFIFGEKNDKRETKRKLRNHWISSIEMWMERFMYDVNEVQKSPNKNGYRSVRRVRFGKMWIFVVVLLEKMFNEFFELKSCDKTEINTNN